MSACKIIITHAYVIFSMIANGLEMGEVTVSQKMALNPVNNMIIW